MLTFYWTELNALRNYGGGYAIVVAPDRAHAIEVAVGAFLAERVAGCFDEKDRAELDRKCVDFRAELNHKTPQELTGQHAVLITGSE